MFVISCARRCATRRSITARPSPMLCHEGVTTTSQTVALKTASEVARAKASVSPSEAQRDLRVARTSTRTWVCCSAVRHRSSERRGKLTRSKRSLSSAGVGRTESSHSALPRSTMMISSPCSSQCASLLVGASNSRASAFPRSTLSLPNTPSSLPHGAVSGAADEGAVRRPHVPAPRVLPPNHRRWGCASVTLIALISHNATERSAYRFLATHTDSIVTPFLRPSRPALRVSSY
mmetsp:Transcript_6339/g.21231  ORF Transcript_6339/g.21231 Transcript_6339/m.21231 type:complete len:234 (+) Transcript_6339:239-940(+)